MIGGEPETDKLSVYSKMFEEVKAALKSKANLPKKTKVQPLGLADVKNDMQLGLWRFIVNPMSKFDFLPYCQEQLKIRGFEELDSIRKEYGVDKLFPLYNKQETTSFPTITYLTERFDSVFENSLPNGLAERTREMFLDGSRLVSMVGVITKKRKLAYANGTKTRMVVDFYNGRQVVNDLVIWPGRVTNKLPSFTGTMGNMNFGIITVKATEYRGRKGGAVFGWEKLSG